MKVGAHWPGSFVRLLWIGFFGVSLPLGATLIGAGWYMGRLARAGAAALERNAQVAGDSRLLAEQTVALERKARQVVVLGEPTVMADYQGRRRELEKVAQDLRTRVTDKGLLVALAKLLEVEKGIYRALTTGPQGRGEATRALDGFGQMHAHARRVVKLAEAEARAEAETVRAGARNARILLLWLAVAAVPVTLMLAAGLARFVARPIRQIDRGIRRMGQGQFDEPVIVRGPRDLEVLGERLDWLRRRLVELEGEKTKFLAHVSHELKTPLTAIREGAELLVEGVPGPLSPGQADLAGIVRDNTVELQGLIENLLNYSVGRARRLTGALSVVDLANLVRETLDDHRAALMARGVRVDESLAPARVRGDPGRLKAIVDNLVSNAVKFSTRGGAVGLGTAWEDGRVSLWVDDDGPGVPPEERSRVFEPFYQGQSQPRGAVQGSGLGLSIVAEYVADHDGEVSVSEAPNGGARFRVSLPGAGEAEAS